jgi:MraZ protein
MGRFRGQYNYSVDAKGRVNIPAKFRKALNPAADETFVICLGPDKCLQAYPQDTWEEYEDKLDAMPPSRLSFKVRRQIYNSVTDSHLDAQGRISLSQYQMDTADIKKNVTLVGHRGYIEIWDTENYQQYMGTGEDFDEAYYKSIATNLAQS